MRSLYSNPNASRGKILAGPRLHIFKPQSVLSATARAAMDAAREQAETKEASVEKSAKRHLRAVKKASVLMRKRRDKRRRLKRVSDKASKTIRRLKLK